MVTRQTKLQLANELAAARNENSVLRAQIETLRAAYAQQQEAWRARELYLTGEISKLRAGHSVSAAQPQYPHEDRLGRRYRIEMHGGREIKCYQPS